MRNIKWDYKMRIDFIIFDFNYQKSHYLIDLRAMFRKLDRTDRSNRHKTGLVQCKKSIVNKPTVKPVNLPVFNEPSDSLP